MVILVSYLFIFVTILRMRSSEGHQKAFSTCGFPPHFHLHLLWDRRLHVPTARLPPFQEHRQNGVCILRHNHPHAESADL